MRRKTLRVVQNTRYGTMTAFVDALQIAERCRCSRKTAERYVRNPDAIPPAALELLKLRTFGQVLDGEFDGWTLDDHGESIVAPTGRQIRPGQIETLAWSIDRSNHLERRLREQQRQIERLERYVEIWRRRAGAPIASNDE